MKLTGCIVIYCLTAAHSSLHEFVRSSLLLVSAAFDTFYCCPRLLLLLLGRKGGKGRRGKWGSRAVQDVIAILSSANGGKETRRVVGV
jgi:hypothetical protein